MTHHRFSSRSSDETGFDSIHSQPFHQTHLHQPSSENSQQSSYHQTITSSHQFSTFPTSTSHPSHLSHPHHHLSHHHDGPMLPPQHPSYTNPSYGGLHPDSRFGYEHHSQAHMSLDHLPPPPPPQSNESFGIIKTYRAYFSLAEVDRMIRIQSGKLPPARVESTRQQACMFMDKVGTRLGL